MITTREINVNLSKGKLKLRQSTTKDVDASIRVEPPKEPIKTRGVSTTTLPDVADIVEKKRRDDIAIEQKLAMKDEKKVVMVEKSKLSESSGELMIEQKDKQNELVGDGTGRSLDEDEQNELIVKKKPWNKMNAKERKEYQTEKKERNEREDKKD